MGFCIILLHMYRFLLINRGKLGFSGGNSFSTIIFLHSLALMHSIFLESRYLQLYFWSFVQLVRGKQKATQQFFVVSWRSNSSHKYNFCYKALAFACSMGCFFIQHNVLSRNVCFESNKTIFHRFERNHTNLQNVHLT